MRETLQVEEGVADVKELETKVLDIFSSKISTKALNAIPFAKF